MSTCLAERTCQWHVKAVISLDSFILWWQLPIRWTSRHPEISNSSRGNFHAWNWRWKMRTEVWIPFIFFSLSHTKSWHFVPMNRPIYFRYASHFCTVFSSSPLSCISYCLLSYFYHFSSSFFSIVLWFLSLPLLLSAVSQALRVLCIPQTQCHLFILHQETLTPIIWRVHKAAQPHDPEDEGRIETDGQSWEKETDEGDLNLVKGENICRWSAEV